MVWSDPEIQKLSREFVPVADEVYLLYPEDPGNLARVQAEPAHQLFKRFGEAMPAGDWHHPGTKQGVYMMGPNGEYLEGRFAASSDPKDIQARLRRALERWEALRKQQKYQNKPIPALAEQVPPGLAASPLLLRVSLRDLPRGKSAASPPRWRVGSFDDGNWASFMTWAWNQNWLGLPEPRALVSEGKEPVEVDAAVVRRICREVLVDNVRGQAPEWSPEHVKAARLHMQRLKTDKVWTMEYRGEVLMDAGAQKYAARLYGQGDWDPKQGRFVRFELIALGDRTGAWQFNQRAQDPGPAPLGIALRLFVPPELAKKPGK